MEYRCAGETAKGKAAVGEFAGHLLSVDVRGEAKTGVGYANAAVSVYEIQTVLRSCPDAAAVVGLYGLDEGAAKPAPPGRAPESSAGGGPEGSVRGKAQVRDIVVREGKAVCWIMQVFCYKAGVFVYDVEPGLRGAVDKIAVGVFNEPAAKPGTDVTGGIRLGRRVEKRAQPFCRGGFPGPAVPLVKADSFPGDNPESSVPALQKVHDPVGRDAVSICNAVLRLGNRPAHRTPFHLSLLPDIESAAGIKANVNRAFTVFIKTRNVSLVLASCRPVINLSHAAILQGKRSAVRGSNPEAAVRGLHQGCHLR